MRYIVSIEETIVQEFEVEACNAEQAIQKAEEKYQNGEFILENCEVHAKKIAVIDSTVETTRWLNF